MATMTKTKNGGDQFEHSGAHAVEFFSKAGSLFTKRQQYYGNEASALDLFKDVWRSGDHETAMKLLFWLRDPRGGAGNRSGFRECAAWLADEAPEWMVANAIQIPKYGRWDDMTALYGNKETSDTASQLWANEILAGSVLASKWADRKDKKVLKALRKIAKGKVKDIGDYRRLLAKARKGVVEVAMSKKEFTNINYEQVPSVAMSRYTNAFNRNDSERFIAYREALTKAIEKGDNTVKVNAGAIYPHDVWRTLKNHGDRKIADAQFASLPDFMAEKGARIMPIADTSGSMGVQVSGSIQAIDISLSLAFYCSDRLGKDNPFYRKFLEFSDEGHLIDWSGYGTLSEVYKDATNYNGLFNRPMGSTNIVKALDTVLAHAKMFNATDEQMPTMLLCISDMQFDGNGYGAGSTPESRNDTVVNKALDKWVEAGYTRPQIVYWNTAGNSGSPERSRSKNVALVSGFSPSILKAVFGNPESMNPYNVMMEAIKDYEVITPA